MQVIYLITDFLAVYCDAQFQPYLTRPDITGAVSIQVIQPAADPGTLATGYFFLAPYLSDFATASYGPQIIDGSGGLVWYGNASIVKRAMDLHVCDYKNANIGNHLCLHDATPIQQGGHSSGLIRFFDNTYTEVDRYNGSGNLVAPDIHELNTPNGLGGLSFIQDVYETVPADLTAYSGPASGFVLSGCFQEIRFDSRQVVFQWCSLDHVPLDDTFLYMPQTPEQDHNLITGDGTVDAPWDYFHINSIGKNTEGDYVVSSRHTDTIFKIAGANSTTGQGPGTILWRLGGKHNDFAMQGNLNFSRQHTVRFHSTTATETQLTLFDNGSDGEFRTANASTGMWITLNNLTMTASLVQQYVSPGNNMSASSQGQVQKLLNDNVLVGWGSLPYFSEYTRDGDLLYHAHFGAAGADYMQSYRVWKYDWTGYPADSPVLLVYAQNCSALHAGLARPYVSWNGATEVSAWRFYVSDSADTGPFASIPGDVLMKDGFETSAQLRLTRAVRYAYVEGLDHTGEVLGMSTVAKTFVPASNVAENCSETGCGWGFQYVPANEQQCW